MAKETKAILVRARELLSDPKSWTQDVMARSVRGTPVVTHSKRARSFCVEGAIERAGLKTTRKVRERARRIVYEKIASSTFVNITLWNDAPQRTHAEVLALLDKAIAAAT